MNATTSINLGPFSFSSALNGARYLLLYPGDIDFLVQFMFSRYEPVTIRKIPANPEISGNSPTIMGEVISRKRGVKVSIGTVMDKSDDLMAFMYRTSVKAYRVPPVANASQNRSPRSGISVKSSVGNRNGSAKHGNDHATAYSSMSFRLFLLSTSFVASKNAVKNANMNQSIIITHIPHIKI